MIIRYFGCCIAFFFSIILSAKALMMRTGMMMKLATIDTLKIKVLESDAGAALAAEDALRERGGGTLNAKCKLRLFDTEKEPRLILYRDPSYWCPYCAKLSMQLEEKRIPYKIEMVPMRSYGIKSQDFLNKVPGGFLPAIELDGNVYTESLDIMVMVDDTFNGPEHRRTLPPRGTPEFEEARQLLGLERQLFRSWCDFVFRGSLGSKRAFERDLHVVEKELERGGKDKPFFMGQSDPGIVDMQYFSHLERIFASVAYWKGECIRGDYKKYPNINAFFDALEKRPSYALTRSDFYTTITDIPPQYGNGVFDRMAPKQHSYEKAISGAEWTLPMNPDALEVKLQPGWEEFEPNAHIEALFRLVNNFSAVAKFASRPAGEGVGRWGTFRPDRSALADPEAKPAKGQALSDVEAALSIVAHILADKLEIKAEHAVTLDEIISDAKRRATTASCLIYLRDRIGVPRDMSYPAARALRCTLGWTVEHLQKKKI